jgi:transcriptional regulator with XRE-family HTH domain
MELKPTLAGRVNQIREFRNLTLRDLAKSTRFTVARLEDIESGLETWLSSADRQILATALRIEPHILKDVESRAVDDEDGVGVTEIPLAVLEDLADAILHGERDIKCPRCKTTMVCSIQEGIDLEENLIQLPMAYCPKCPFVLK